MKPDQMKPFFARFSRLKVAVIGDVILDHYIWGDVARISPEAPVPLVDVSHENHRLGGAANVALNLTTLGTRASLFGRMGADEGATVCKGLLQDEGIVWLGEAVPPAPNTIIKTRVVARQQQLCRLDRESRRADYALSGETWAGLMDKLLDGADGVLVSDYAKGVVDDGLLRHLKKQAAERRIPVFCDPKPRFGRDFSGLELLTPNRSEAIAMSGLEPDPRDPFPSEAVVEAIYQAFRPKHLVVTLGAEGMLYAQDGCVGGIVPTFAREVFDVSGAGDTVVATLTLALLAGASLEEAVIMANTAAGVVVSKLGTATVTCAEILAYAEDHGLGG